MEKRVWEWEGKTPWLWLSEIIEGTIRRKGFIHRKSSEEVGMIHAGTWDFASEIEIPIKQIIVEAELRLLKSIVSMEAAQKGRLLFMLELTSQRYGELKELNWKLAKRNHPDER